MTPYSHCVVSICRDDVQQIFDIFPFHSYSIFVNNYFSPKFCFCWLGEAGNSIMSTFLKIDFFSVRFSDKKWSFIRSQFCTFTRIFVVTVSEMKIYFFKTIISRIQFFSKFSSRVYTICVKKSYDFFKKIWELLIDKKKNNSLFTF